jgi:hypothetical protein
MDHKLVSRLTIDVSLILKPPRLKLQRILILVIILLSLIPAYYVHAWLQRVTQPRRSFGHFLLYLLACLAFVFAYTFVVVAIISRVFPPAKG